MLIDFALIDFAAGPNAIIAYRARSPHIRWTPHPVLVTKKDKGDYIWVLLESYYTSSTGWGVHLSHMAHISFHWGFGLILLTLSPKPI